MFNSTTVDTGFQYCYVDSTNPYNPVPFLRPYEGFVPSSPGPPPITITTTGTAQPCQDDEKPMAAMVAPFILALSEADKADLEAMIRRVIKEEVESVVRDVRSRRDEAERQERWQDEW